ncbi:MAG: ABC transporter ATP-binding protein [Actinomycetia bacterium]|nr:ABC transporter ATP-binding protein [Actinomycetes bacterium]
MSSQSAAALDAHQLYRFFRADDEEVLALRGVSISVEAGEIVAVVGPSGSGKSTLLSCLAGLDEPAAGTVRVGGRRMTGRSESMRASLRAEHVGVLFQGGNLIEHLTIAQNVRLARHLGNKRHDADSTILDGVGLLPRAAAYPAELSGGESARAGLAVALSNDPDVLLADEPTGELDGETEQRVLALFRDRADRGCAVLLVTHSPNVTAVADRVVALSDGLVAP